MKKHKKEIILYILAALLMIIRVDLWWWGKEVYPLVHGWITLPMIYQFFIWAAGCTLVFFMCFRVWDSNDPGEV